MRKKTAKNDRASQIIFSMIVACWVYMGCRTRASLYTLAWKMIEVEIQISTYYHDSLSLKNACKCEHKTYYFYHNTLYLMCNYIYILQYLVKFFDWFWRHLSLMFVKKVCRLVYGNNAIFYKLNFDFLSISWDSPMDLG